jgi:hypothetical protein
MKQRPTLWPCFRSSEASHQHSYISSTPATLWCGQAPGEDSEVYLVPRAIFRDPFRGGDNILVLCDAYEPPRANPDGTVRVCECLCVRACMCVCVSVCVRTRLRVCVRLVRG